MFILTTASQVPKNPGVRNHSKDTDYLTHSRPQTSRDLFCAGIQRP